VLACFGAAEVDSQRHVAAARARDRMGEGRARGDVRGVWRSRFAGAGMCCAGDALNVCGAEARATRRNKEDEGRIAIVCIRPKRGIAGKGVAGEG
jgi:hypothetical protein